jgi:SAM-dependent methyltransferase
MRYLAASNPELELRGNDPSAELLQVAHERFGIPEEQLDCADSTNLPYEDGQFDVVIETAVLHHVPDPSAVIDEMLRVSRLAIFISDSNMYGLGAPLAGIAKLLLSRARLLRPINRWRRGGHDWYYTEGDGIGWSYSVFDSLGRLREQCEDVLVVPTTPKGALGLAAPIIASPTCLVAGFKQALPGAATAAR